MQLPVTQVFALHRSNTPRTCNRSVGERSKFIITARALHALSFERQQHRVIGIEIEAKLNMSFHHPVFIGVIAIHGVERETRCRFITFGDLFCIASGFPACKLEQRHSAPVCGVAVSADGRRAVSASSDKTLKIWDVEAGRLIHTWKVTLPPVWGVAMSADGRRAVSASKDYTLMVWDVKTGHALHTMKGRSASVWGVALSADGRRAVSASKDGGTALALPGRTRDPAVYGQRDRGCADPLAPANEASPSSTWDRADSHPGRPRCWGQQRGGERGRSARRFCFSRQNTEGLGCGDGPSRRL